MDKQTLYKMCHKQAAYLAENPTDAEDLAGEMFLNILEKNKLEKYDPAKSQFQTWLHRVMKNFYCDFLKKENKVILCDEFHANVLYEDVSACSQLDKKMKLFVLKELLQSKNTKSLKVIYYLFINGMSTSETAIEMGMPLKNIPSYKIRGIHMLQGELKKRNYI